MIMMDQKIQSDCYWISEFLELSYLENSGITNLEPDLLVKSY